MRRDELRQLHKKSNRAGLRSSLEPSERFSAQSAREKRLSKIKLGGVRLGEQKFRRVFPWGGHRQCSGRGRQSQSRPEQRGERPVFRSASAHRGRGSGPARGDADQISTAVRPLDVLEEIWVNDVVNLIWERLRLRLRRLRAPPLQSHLPDYCSELATNWASREPELVAEVDADLAICAGNCARDHRQDRQEPVHVDVGEIAEGYFAFGFIGVIGITETDRWP